MKATVRRVLTAFAATALLTAGSAAMAAPAHAEVHATVLDVIGAEANGAIALLTPDGTTLLALPNPLSPLV
ncbi:hypothetical protein [Streptomyces telluris]|uniref:Secreted protein n=1 Tax=Streptomyces telluris TaxID=2720021 RepID=A0A9X2RLU0_9ACTN|nr:hypothetical protein [Streptomyces telluris]MCQ8771252.1 hypothetical protein [Streptomyces telluris]NJP77615.1 hypothetical protein [Streptomyces telluris]